MNELIMFLLMMSACGFAAWLGYNMHVVGPPPKSGDACDKCNAPCPSGEGVLWHGERYCTRCYADWFF